MQKIYLSALASGVAQLTKLLTLACQIKIEKEEEEEEEESIWPSKPCLGSSTGWTVCLASSRFDAGGFKHVVRNSRDETPTCARTQIQHNTRCVSVRNTKW